MLPISLYFPTFTTYEGCLILGSNLPRLSTLDRVVDNPLDSSGGKYSLMGPQSHLPLCAATTFGYILGYIASSYELERIQVRLLHGLYVYPKG